MSSGKWIENEDKIPTSLGYYPTERKLVDVFISGGENPKQDIGFILMRKPRFIAESCDAFLEVNLTKAFREGVKIAEKNGFYLLNEIRPEHIVGVIEKA